MLPQTSEQQPSRLESSEATQLLNEYEKTLPELATNVRRWGDEMRTMRDAGIPDRKTYEDKRTQVVQALEQTTDLQYRLNALVQGELQVTSASESPSDIEEKKRDITSNVIQEAQRVRKEHEEEFDAAEDAFRDVLMEDAKWHDERTKEEVYGRREGDYGPREDERKLPLELYEQKVEALLHEVGMLEWAFEHSLPPNITSPDKLDALYEDPLREKLEMFHEGLTGAYDQLTELDEQTPEREQSKERKQLLLLIYQMIERYPLTKKNDTPKEVPSIQAAFQVQRNVKATYAAISHRLPLERRRYFRNRIARLSAVVDETAENAWRAAVAQAAVPSTPPPPEPPILDESAIRTRVQLTMTRAVLAAHPIADSVIARTHRKKGVLGTLANALRLK